MSTSNQQTLADSGASKRPPMLEKGSYIPWASRFMRFPENKQEDGERMRRLIKVGPYVRQLIPDPDKLDQPNATIIEPVSKMCEINKKQYYADIRVMDYLLQGIPNDIYNLVDACKTSHQIWERIRRLMYGLEKTEQQIHSRLVNEFDKFVLAEGESLFSVYERLTTIVNVMDRNQICPSIHYNLSGANISSYSHSSQPYYVTHPSSIIDSEKDYQGEIQGDAQEDKLTTAMMLLARAITQHYSTPTNNRRQNRNPVATARNGMMLLALKDKVGGNLKEEENDFMLDNYYGDDALEELNAAVIMMAHIQPIDDTGATSSRFDADILNEVNASTRHNNSRMPSKSVHEHKTHAKLKTVNNTSDDDQIDSSIIFDDPYVEDNGRKDEHDSISHDQYVALQSMIDNVQNEAKNERSMNNELKKQQAFLQKELEMFKERVKTLEKQPVKALKNSKLHDEFVQQEYATLRIQNETELSKKAFKERKNSYLEEIVDLTEQLRSHDQNLKRLKKSIKAQPKMYNSDSLHNTKFKINSPDYEETLENAEES
ncbi:hypothetical protein Tco_0509406 [Tanacetum coccineum]